MFEISKGIYYAVLKELDWIASLRCRSVSFKKLLSISRHGDFPKFIIFDPKVIQNALAGTRGLVW